MRLPFNIDLAGKVAVVTGGNGVLGSYFAKALAQCGAKVAILGRTEEANNKVVAEIEDNGGRAKGLTANVLSLDELEKAKMNIHEWAGSCDILINMAGGNHPKGSTSHDYLKFEDMEDVKEGIQTFFDLEAEGMNYVFQLNFLGTLLPTQVFSKDMIHPAPSTIINISSMNAFKPLTRIPAYSGAKAAVSNFTQWLAVHFSKVNIRVNAIAPGFFLTEQNRALLLEEDGSPTERSKKILSQTPMERFGEPEELIGTLLWLIDSNASGFVNGIVVPIDGGFSAYSGV